MIYWELIVLSFITKEIEGVIPIIILNDDWYNNIRISMDSVGRWADNIYIERFWRTIKQEQIYINPTSNIAELKQQIEQYIYFYNHQRPHQSLHYNTPYQIYSGESEGNKVIHYSQKLQKITAIQALMV